MRVGIGFDIHRLVPERRFVVGGVEIPFAKGPEGHSDGDVLCHAIIDALLGAAGLGDIGLWFPPTDEKYRGANSIVLLETVGKALQEKGFQIGNIDSIIICEKPKLSPHYEAMRSCLCAALEIAPENLSIKSTTYEGLGEIGAGEAIAAKAIALIRSTNLVF